MNSYYNSIAGGYEELHQEEQLAKLELIKTSLKKLKININPEFRLLDIGCGSGISTRFWEFTNADKTGIDPSEKLIGIAQAKDLKSQYFVESAEDLSFEDSLFDFVISLTAIQNFSNLKEGISEIARVSKKHGVLSFLKKSEKKDEILKLIQIHFKILKEIEEEKDLILICEKK